MKATAKKIKDNEWIAEVSYALLDEAIDRTPNIRNYHIVCAGDKEHLEKKSLNGKYIDIEIYKNIMDYEVAMLSFDEYFYSKNDTTPPIHSDPAGEIEQLRQIIYEMFDEFYYTTTIERFQERMQKIKFQPPTPQTGRTYTEGEVVELLEWMRESGYHPVVTNKETLTGWLQGGMSIIYPSKAMPEKYLKQNPKP